MFIIEISPERARVDVSGDIDLNTSSYLEAAINVAAVGSPYDDVIVALENCSSLDASCLTVLLRAKETLRARLVVVPAAAAKLLNLPPQLSATT